MSPLPQHNLAAVHEAIAARVPDRPCIVFRERRLTYADVTERTRRLAHVLHDHGLGARADGRAGLANHESHQDHLAIYAYNGNEYLEAMLGAYKARVAPVNVNYRYVAEELRYLLQNSAAKAIVYHSALAPTLASVLPEVPELRLLLQVTDDSGNDLLPGAQWYEEALAAASPERPAWAGEWSPDDLYILYTGGTTGMPKGVLWRQADIYRSVMGGRNGATTEPWATIDEAADAAAANGMVVLPAAPFMHGAGHWIAFLATNQGSTVVVQDRTDRLDPADICSVVERERVQFLQLVGDAFGRPIVEEMETGRWDVSSLAIVLSGGAALSAPIKERFLQLLPNAMIIDGLGSSEGGGQATQVTVAGGPVSTGTFTPGKGSVVVSDDLTALLEPGHDGIGWLAKVGGDVPLGYLGDPEKTARTFPVIGGERVSIPGDRARWLPDGTSELLVRDSVTINSGGAGHESRPLRHRVQAAEGADLRRPGGALAVGEGRLPQGWHAASVLRVVLRRRKSRASDGRRILRLEYPSTSDPRPRWGHGRSAHAGVATLFEAREAGVRSVLRDLASYHETLSRIRNRADPADPAAPCWVNEWLVGLDTVALYGFVRSRRPARYVEVGSGESTRVVRRAIVDGALATRIRSIDPEPRVEVDPICDEVLRSPLETVDLRRAFGDLGPGDVVFFDGSHRVLPGSDCVAFYVDVLPSLPAGVLVGVHDVWLPEDYPPGFFELWWSEQYLLAAILMADGGRRYDVVLPSYWATGVPELAAELDPVWAHASTAGVNRRGSALWLQVV